MEFHPILYAIPLLSSTQKEYFCEITKKTGYLSLAILITNNVSSIEAEDIKNTPSLQYTSGIAHSNPVEPMTGTDYAHYINFATALAPAPRTFDYDPSLLPDVAEAIFALRIKHANIGEPFVINLSGNYLLEFTKDKIYVLDTYTKNRDVYEYQSTNPNITIGLGVSKGLPNNYKSIVIKEDANGQLYNYAALYSDNISTDETMLNETLSHPFYQVAGKYGVEDNVTISKAMAFYKEQMSHKRHPRCVKSSSSVLKQFMEILGFGNPLCGPKATSDIRSANHKSAADMTLDQQLVEATVNESKYPEKLGYRLLKRVDLNGKNPVALLAAADFCKVSVMTIVGKHRQKRSPDLENCPHWVDLMVGLYMAFGLKFTDINKIVESVKRSNDIPASFFPDGQYPPKKEGNIELLVRLISKHIHEAAEALQTGAAELGEAAGASSLFHCPAESQACGENAAAAGVVEIFTLNGQQFIPEPNEVKILKNKNRMTSNIVVLDGEQYTTNVIYLGDFEQKINIHVHNAIAFFKQSIENWIIQIKERLARVSSQKRNIIYESRAMAIKVRNALNEWIDSQNLVISVIYQNQVLVGISIGRIDERVYYLMYDIVSPETLFGDDGACIEQLTYLRSEVLKYLLSKGLIDRSELAVISNYSTGHDEL